MNMFGSFILPMKVIYTSYTNATQDEIKQWVLDNLDQFLDATIYIYHRSIIEYLIPPYTTCIDESIPWINHNTIQNLVVSDRERTGVMYLDYVPTNEAEVKQVIVEQGRTHYSEFTLQKIMTDFNTIEDPAGSYDFITLSPTDIERLLR